MPIHLYRRPAHLDPRMSIWCMNCKHRYNHKEYPLHLQVAHQLKAHDRHVCAYCGKIHESRRSFQQHWSWCQKKTRTLIRASLTYNVRPSTWNSRNGTEADTRAQTSKDRTMLHVTPKLTGLAKKLTTLKAAFNISHEGLVAVSRCIFEFAKECVTNAGISDARLLGTLHDGERVSSSKYLRHKISDVRGMVGVEIPLENPAEMQAENEGNSSIASSVSYVPLEVTIGSLIDLGQLNFSNSTRIHVHAFIDDFLATSNALSGNAKRSKFVAVYYTFDCEKVEAIHVALMATRNVVRNVGLKAVLRPLVNELNHLSQEGFRHGDKQLYVELASISGDNLGLCELVGKNGNFSSGYVCRFCKIRHHELTSIFTDSGELRRTLASGYAEHEHNQGCDTRNVLLDLENFDWTVQLPIGYHARYISGRHSQGYERCATRNPYHLRRCECTECSANQICQPM